MEKMMLINVAEPEETRIAILEDDQLEEFYSERTSKEHIVGNIYKARILNIEPSIEAAFLDFGYYKNGFLHVSDISAGVARQSKGGSGGKERDIRKALNKGQEILVQVTKEGIGNKGPSVTTYLSIPGRFLVLMPDLPRHGVSRKIDDDKERKKLKQILQDLGAPNDMGIIVRTAGQGQTKRELGRDLDYLQRLWELIQHRAKGARGPSLIYQESDVIIRVIRDVFSADINTILIDEKDVYERVREFLNTVMPRYVRRVKLYQDKQPLFEKYKVDEKLNRVHLRKLPLKSGASIVIEQTEALVAVDVNSGKFRSEEDPEESAFKINMEAAKEIARQLRLRDLGGVIVIDFIDMRDRDHQRDVEKSLWEALKHDRARIKMLRMSQFGIVELTRQRVRASLSQAITRTCPTCGGLGIIKSNETLAIQTMRRLNAVSRHAQVARIQLKVSAEIAEYLLNEMRSRLTEIEQETGKRIVVNAVPQLAPETVEIHCYKRGGEEVSVG